MNIIEKRKDNDFIEKRKDNDFISKAQKFCRIVRSDICNLTLNEMAEIFHLNMKNLSAWENGRSNKADYLFYYYDLCDNEDKKQLFIKAIFESDGKNIELHTTKNLEKGITNYTINFIERN